MNGNTAVGCPTTEMKKDTVTDLIGQIEKEVSMTKELLGLNYPSIDCTEKEVTSVLTHRISKLRSIKGDLYDINENLQNL